ncbi:MAG: tRNA-modifying protein YgfZ [marine bacterium B5-7]|nr:MAG: tRNA-modifying protein YgfZ [marine bacterium B5-7]
MSIIPYTHYHCEGEDTETFLQGQLTADIAALAVGEDVLAAHCNPKGRVVSLWRVLKRDDGFVLRVPSALAETAMNNLKKFMLRAKVRIAVIDKETPHQVRGDSGSAQDNSVAELIQQGIPEIFPETSEQFTPHDINLPSLGAVSFNKGCYIGQEIVARMHFLGKIKQHMRCAAVVVSATPGDVVMNDQQQAVGKVVLSDGEQALCVVKDAALETPLFLHEVAMTWQALPYSVKD